MILAIVGPTGTGKTETALALAERIGAEIVNADSRQVYRGLDIGSAKPTRAERARVPHHLFDVVEPDEPFDCARYRVLAAAVVADIQARGRSVVLVGGTGLYLKVLRYGLFPGPPRDRALRDQLDALETAEPGALHARLAAVDGEAARRIHRHDRVRLIRALEVAEVTGRTISDWQEAHGFRDAEIDCRMIGLTLDRKALYERLDRRCRRMIEAGFVDEVRGLAQRGYRHDLPALQSIGYREITAHLRGACDLETAVGEMARATRRFAKRQMTWFRADPTIEWLDVGASSPEEIVSRLCGSD